MEKLKERLWSSVTLLALPLLVLSGCAESSQSEADPADSTTQEIMNCGVEVRVDETPERVFTVKSSTLELMLALGLEDKVVGSAYLDGPVPDEFTPEGWSPNVVSDEIPSREVFLSEEPDFVLAGWESNVSADGIGERGDLADLGVQSYVLPPACEFEDEAAQEVTFDDIFAMTEEVGTIFDAEQEAADLIAAQQQQLDEIQQPTKEVDVLWYSSGTDAPFVAGGAGTPQMIMEAAGVTNLLADEARTWFSMSWEAFVAESPDYIVLVDAPWNTAEQKRERLESHPAASQMEAVEQENYIEVPFAATEAGVRNVDAAILVSEAVADTQGAQ